MKENEAPVFGLKSIDKSFERRTILRGLSLELYRGDFALLLGANGSGKSTLLRICSGLLRPESGEAFFTGSEAGRCSGWRYPPAVLIGHSGHMAHLYSMLSVRENLALTRALLAPGVELDDYIEVWELSQVADVRVARLSRGMQVRTSLARALMHSPGLVFLDEPTSALDDAAVNLLLRVLEKMRTANRSSILIASHDLGRLQPQAGRILLLEDGQISADSRRTEREQGLSRQAAIEDCLSRYRNRNR